jgi:hypothetical protein
VLIFLALCAPFELFDDSRSPPWLAPGADGNANSATEVFIEEWNAFVEIDVPFVFTTYCYLFPQDRIGRAGVRADLAAAAKVINAVCGPGRGDQRHIREHGCESE